MGGFRRRVIAGVMEGLNADLRKTLTGFLADGEDHLLALIVKWSSGAK